MGSSCKRSGRTHAIHLFDHILRSALSRYSWEYHAQIKKVCFLSSLRRLYPPKWPRAAGEWGANYFRSTCSTFLEHPDLSRTCSLGSGNRRCAWRVTIVSKFDLRGLDLSVDCPAGLPRQTCVGRFGLAGRARRAVAARSAGSPPRGLHIAQWGVTGAGSHSSACAMQGSMLLDQYLGTSSWHLTR